MVLVEAVQEDRKNQWLVMQNTLYYNNVIRKPWIDKTNPENQFAVLTNTNTSKIFDITLYMSICLYALIDIIKKTNVWLGYVTKPNTIQKNDYKHEKSTCLNIDRVLISDKRVDFNRNWQENGNINGQVVRTFKFVLKSDQTNNYSRKFIC